MINCDNCGFDCENGYGDRDRAVFCCLCTIAGDKDYAPAGYIHLEPCEMCLTRMTDGA